MVEHHGENGEEDEPNDHGEAWTDPNLISCDKTHDSAEQSVRYLVHVSASEMLLLSPRHF